MTIWQLLTVSAAAIGLAIIVVMAVVPFLIEEGGRASTPGRMPGRHRHGLGPPPHPPGGAA